MRSDFILLAGLSVHPLVTSGKTVRISVMAIISLARLYIVS